MINIVAPSAPLWEPLQDHPLSPLWRSVACDCWSFYLEHSAVHLSQLNAVVAGQGAACGRTKDLRAGVQIPLQITIQIQDLGCPV